VAPLQQQRARLRAYNILIGFVEEIDGHLWHDGGGSPPPGTMPTPTSSAVWWP